MSTLTLASAWERGYSELWWVNTLAWIHHPAWSSCADSKYTGRTKLEPPGFEANDKLPHHLNEVRWTIKFTLDWSLSFGHTKDLAVECKHTQQGWKLYLKEAKREKLWCAYLLSMIPQIYIALPQVHSSGRVKISIKTFMLESTLTLQGRRQLFRSGGA